LPGECRTVRSDLRRRKRDDTLTGLDLLSRRDEHLGIAGVGPQRAKQGQ
jgi:hypothetical protein